MRVVAVLLGSVALVALAPSAAAAATPTVPLGTSASYAVLAGQTVTNTGGTTLGGSLGVAPGSAVTGFPPGLVAAPYTTDVANAAAQQAQSDLTVAYVDAAGRSVTATTTADLGGLSLQAGVYAGPSKGALALTGTVTLDGAGDAGSVFIFQTNAELITSSGSNVALINGAQACNVFWQVGSSATLGSGSVFAGNILALTSITVTSGVTVHGRALARNGSVTLDNDVFTRAGCATSGGGGTGSGGGSGGSGGSGSTPNTIPATGAGSSVLIGAAAVLVVVGVGAVRASRRRALADAVRR